MGGTQTIDYEALAKQAGAISSQPASGAVDYAALAKQAGAISSLPPQSNQQKTQPPGFLKRLAQSLGVPTSMQELQQAQPSTAEQIIGPAATAGRMLWNYGKTALRGVQQGGQEAYEAGENVGEGQPLGPNLGKAASGVLHAGLQATPIIGPSIETAGQDVQSGNYQGAAGGLAGVLGQVAVPYAIEKGGAALNRLRAPLGDMTTQPRGTIPAESASPSELKAYADQNGIPLNAAQATEHNLPRNLQSAGERATVGGTAVRQQIKASQAATAQHAENLLDSFSPNTPDLATAGDAIQQGVSQALERQQAQSRQAYAAIDQQAGGTSVDLRPLKQTAQQIFQDSSFVRKAGALDQRRAAAILQDIGNLPDNGSFSDAQQLRSALLDASRSPELAISNQAQGWIKQLTGATDNAMMTAAQSTPGLETSFRAANDHWQQLQDDFNNPRSPLAQILQEPDPSKVPQKLTQKGQIGGSPYNAQLLDRYGIDKGPVKWAILNDVAGKDFKLQNKSLGGYGDDFLRSVFSPDELDHVYKTGAIARSVGVNTNPSGTAGVSGAIADVQKPIRSMIPKYGAAKLTNSPRFNRRLLTPPAPNTGPTPLRYGLSASPARGTNQPESDDEFWNDAAAAYKARHGRL